MSNDITDVIDVLRRGDFYGAGECTEIAQGKHEVIYSWSALVRKVKRIFKAYR